MNNSLGKSRFTWREGQQCAVSLTYDDGLPVHTSLVAPLLEELGLRGTFYVPVHKSDLSEHPEQWRRLAQADHELGNHTLFHPCRRVPPEAYPWLEKAYDLSAYTPRRLRDEVQVANFILRLIDGKTARTFANPCCHTTIGAGSAARPIGTLIKDLFVAARGAWTDAVIRPSEGTDRMNLGCISADGHSFPWLVQHVEQARACGGWAVFMIHGIGRDTHSFFLETETHRQFVEWLADQGRAVWTAPFIEIASGWRHALRAR